MIGKVYGIPPQPPDESSTTYLQGGPLSIGVEYRVVDQAALRETYKDDPAHLAELERESPEGGFAAEGLSLHVVLNGHEYLAVRPLRRSAALPLRPSGDRGRRASQPRR